MAVNGNDEKRAAGPIICPGHSRPVPNCKYSKVTEDGYFLISACLDGKAMLREGSSGDWIGTFMGHKGAVWDADLNDTATRAATASGDFTAKLWDAVSGECLHTMAHKHIVKSSLFSQDSKSLYTGGQEKKIRIFDLENYDSEAGVMEGHEHSIGYLSLTPDPNLLVSGAAEKNIRVWDIRTQQVVKTLATEEDVTCLTVSNDGTTLCASSGQTVTLWDSSSFEMVKSFALPRVVDCVAYHPDAKKFVTGSDSELWVRAYDFESGDEIACNKGHHGPVRSVAFNPNGDNYASGSEDGTIRIWEFPKEGATK